MAVEVLIKRKFVKEKADELAPLIVKLRSLAIMQPRVPNDLEGISEMRNWQRKVFGNEICSILKALEK